MLQTPVFKTPGVAMVRPTSYYQNLASRNPSISPVDQVSMLNSENQALIREFFKRRETAFYKSQLCQSYPCSACEDCFASQTALSLHLSRRSAVVKLFCRRCKQQLTFYNRCAAVVHRQKHSVPSQYDAMNADVDIFADITLEIIDLSTFNQWFDGEEFKRISDPDEFFRYEEALIAANKLASEDIEHTKTDTASFKCLECGTVCENSDQLCKHFAYNLPVNQKQFICPTCHAVYFSKCGISAHQRCSHAAANFKAPFLCPECGCESKNEKQWSEHLLSHRDRPATLISWRCSKCLTFYSSWEVMAAHIASAHFVSRDNDQNNVRCCFCPVMVPKNKESLTAHIRLHTMSSNGADNTSFKVFRCALCGRLMENKSGLSSHFRTAHRMNVPAADIDDTNVIHGGGKCQLEQQDSPQEYSQSSTSSSAVPNGRARLCKVCNKVFSCSGSLYRHMHRLHPERSTPVVRRKVAIAHSSTTSNNHEQVEESSTKKSKLVMSDNFKCLKCNKMFESSQQRFIHGQQEHLKKNRLVCLLCKNLPIQNASMLLRHFNKHLGERPSDNKSNLPIFVCERHCKTSFTDSGQALNHMRFLHNFKVLLCAECNKNDFGNETEFNTHTKQCGGVL